MNLPLLRIAVLSLALLMLAAPAQADTTVQSGPVEQDASARLALLESEAQQEAANKALVKRWLEELWDAGDYSKVGEILSDDFRRHSEGYPASGPDDYVAIIQSLHDGFPDSKIIQVDELLADGDRVFVRWRWTGTHTAPFRGNPASGKAIDVLGEDVIRIQDGRITDVWPLFDSLRVLLQIGAIQSPQVTD